MSEVAQSFPAMVLGFDGASRPSERSVAVEQPLQISYGDVPFGVMMLTPRDLDDFAYGFSLTEGIIESGADVRGVHLAEGTDGLRLTIDLIGSRLHAHLARRRSLAGRTGCGLCGVEDLAALPRAAVMDRPKSPVALQAIARALGELDGHQPLNALTHAVHGAAWCAPDGAISFAREDVGRHNALDKLIGALLRARVRPEDGFVLITSRASFEMVEKVATFGARTLVAISAPTSLAVARAQALDVTLLAIARRDAVTVFHGLDRVVTDTR